VFTAWTLLSINIAPNLTSNATEQSERFMLSGATDRFIHISGPQSFAGVDIDRSTSKRLRDFIFVVSCISSTERHDIVVR